MTDDKSDDQFSEQETAERLERALLRALNTPPKPHKPKERPASNGRVKKGR